MYKEEICCTELVNVLCDEGCCKAPRFWIPVTQIYVKLVTSTPVDKQ